MQTTLTRTLPPMPLDDQGQAESNTSEQLNQFQKIKMGLQEAGLEVTDELKESIEALEAALAPIPPRISHKQLTQV